MLCQRWVANMLVREWTGLDARHNWSAATVVRFEQCLCFGLNILSRCAFQVKVSFHGADRWLNSETSMHEGATVSLRMESLRGICLEVEARDDRWAFLVNVCRCSVSGFDGGGEAKNRRNGGAGPGKC